MTRRLAFTLSNMDELAQLLDASGLMELAATPCTPLVCIVAAPLPGAEPAAVKPANSVGPNPATALLGRLKATETASSKKGASYQQVQLNDGGRITEDQISLAVMRSIRGSQVAGVIASAAPAAAEQTSTELRLVRLVPAALHVVCRPAALAAELLSLAVQRPPHFSTRLSLSEHVLNMFSTRVLNMFSTYSIADISRQNQVGSKMTIRPIRRCKLDSGDLG